MAAQNVNYSEVTALVIGALILTWGVFRWFATAPVPPDPWDAEVAGEIANDDCPQICHRCLSQHDSSAHFCPRCGATLGTFTCLMPPLYSYAIGDVFRAGVDGNYRRSPFLK